MKMTIEKMVMMFQCPGCYYWNSNLMAECLCENYSLCARGLSCASHLLGNEVVPGIALVNDWLPRFSCVPMFFAFGLPNGFNLPGTNPATGAYFKKMQIELYPDANVILKQVSAHWDYMSIPVWALEEDDFLFIRTYAPFVDKGTVEVIYKGTIENLLKGFNVIDVKPFIDEIRIRYKK